MRPGRIGRGQRSMVADVLKYARVMGLRRCLVSVPILVRCKRSYWYGLIAGDLGILESGAGSVPWPICTSSGNKKKKNGYAGGSRHPGVPASVIRPEGGRHAEGPPREDPYCLSHCQSLSRGITVMQGETIKTHTEIYMRLRRKYYQVIACEDCLRLPLLFAPEDERNTTGT